ncbi:FxsA family protein [Thermostaphylospora chromogena]|uniref:UPF0716 protein FxsA n=1 Tax=Thermostaphylospora chromogena TaxID=35622 RepID=A0A1H1HHN1_9ACTN|nr:FxsA family protein [Thermostaphylospora chromogena]SDR24626.1 UPF0716 protein FxsA [Thermostaphylospora chromogena]
MRLLLFLAFLVVPVLEIWVLIRVGEVIGGWTTVGLLFAAALSGSWLIRREGRRVWQSVSESLAAGRIPDRELGDAALLLAGGALLVAPGFVTDIVGLACVLPVTRPLVRGAARWFFAQRLRKLAQAGPMPGMGGPLGFPFGAPEGDGPTRHGNRTVIHGEVIRDEPAGDPDGGTQARRPELG